MGITPTLQSDTNKWGERSLICMHRQILYFHNQAQGDLTIACLLYLSSLVKDSVENSQQIVHIVHFTAAQ